MAPFIFDQKRATAIRACWPLYIPDNYWNAYLPEQAILFNGALGLPPIELGANHWLHYSAGAAAARSTFDNLILVLVHDLEKVEVALRYGMPLIWTKPENLAAWGGEKYSAPLEAMLARNNPTIETSRFFRFGKSWIAYRATIANPR